MQTITPKEQIDFETNKRLLNRYRFIEYESLRILAGWLPATAKMEFKLAIGRLLWEDAQHVQQLYQRLREVQTPAFRPPDDEALEALMAEAINAPSEWDLLAGLFRVIKPALVDAYRWHCAQTFANPDAPTLYAFKHILLDEEEQVRWGAEALADHPVGEWDEHIAEWVRLAGKNDDVISAQVGPKLKTDTNPKGAGRTEGGINVASRELGIERTAAQRATKVAGLSADAKAAARETGLDKNQSALLKAAKEAPEQQAAKVREIAEQRAVKPAPAPLNDLETEEQWMTAIMRVWNRAAPQWRERFLETVDTPVFDRTNAA
jgi:hypothetical protein